MDSYYRTLKVELVYWEDYKTRVTAMQSTSDYIEHFYIRQRRHSTIDYVGPPKFELSA